MPDREELYSRPVKMMPGETVLTSCRDCDADEHGYTHDEHGDAFFAADADASELALPIGCAQEDNACSSDSDEHGKYIELCFPFGTGKTVLDESQLYTYGQR